MRSHAAQGLNGRGGNIRLTGEFDTSEFHALKGNFPYQVEGRRHVALKKKLAQVWGDRVRVEDHTERVTVLANSNAAVGGA
jgi:hypothetical protein